MNKPAAMLILDWIKCPSTCWRARRGLNSATAGALFCYGVKNVLPGRAQNRTGPPAALISSSSEPEKFAPGVTLEHQHSGIVAVMRIGRDGKMRPNSASIPKLENQSDELVVAADSGSADPTQMKIGMVVGERCETGAELEAREAAMLSTPASVEFRDEDAS
jgi:hypothetical protein